MDEAQREKLLQSIAVSSGTVVPGAIITQADRNAAYSLLDQSKRYNKTNDLASARRLVSGCIDLLSRDAHLVCNNAVDVTTPTKLYALGCISDFVKTKYYTGIIGDADRASLRMSVLTAARQLILSSCAEAASVPPPSKQILDESRASRRILGSRISALLSDIVVRDFPQRWTTFASDVLGNASDAGGLWDSVDGEGVGTRMCLECLSFVVEDCTDSDFNAKISTSRRNDVLTGLNEISSQIVPQTYQLISEQYNMLVTIKQKLLQMESFLSSNGRTLQQMTSQERSQYEAEKNRQLVAGSLLVQCLGTVHKFCLSMPLEWVFSATSSITGTGPGSGEQQDDFVSAFTFLLREDTCSIQVLAVSCLEATALRKIESDQWFRLISSLPRSVADANQTLANEENARRRLNAVGYDGKDELQLLVDELPFHQALSRMLSTLISSHVAHITTDKQFLICSGEKFQLLSAYLGVLSEMLNHPCGRVCSEQLNMWINLLRDPQIVQTTILTPFLPQVLNAYMTHLVKMRWDDVEEGNHPLSSLLDASWTEKEEYETWLNDLRSRTSQLFKHIANCDPQLAATTINNKVRGLLTAHGNGEPHDHIDVKTNRLTQRSDAILLFDGVQQPFDNILHGLPSWCLKEDGPSTFGTFSIAKTAEIRASVRASLSQLANSIVSWSPKDVWLQHSRASMLRSLKFFWYYDPSTLPAGVDSLLLYLSAKDEWTTANPASTPTSTSTSMPMLTIEKLSGEIIGLRKKSGVSLISVSKYVPHLLVPWIEQLSERSRQLLSSNDILPANRMNLYEFLSCVATAVQDPVARSHFVGNVLANAIEVLESSVVQDAVSSMDKFMSFLGISQALENSESVTNPDHVHMITRQYAKMFSAFNQLLSVGKRCHEAAKRRPNGGIPMLHTQPPLIQPPGGGGVGCRGENPTSAELTFPDEGPVGINDLSYDDPFLPLWPKFLPTLLRTMDVVLRLWHPEFQARLLNNPIQRFVYAISDDEAYLAKHQNSSVSNGGVFGDGGTAGSVVSGWDRRDVNLAPRWSGWFNELRNTLFQLLGLMANQRVLFAPEIAPLYPDLVKVLVDASHLRSMEHRHITQLIKQFIEQLLLSCPSTLYRTHVGPLLGPTFEHLKDRLRLSWTPIINATGVAVAGSSAPVAATNAVASTTPLTSSTCSAANVIASASRGDDLWVASYYARGGLFVGDLDTVTSEAVADKVRVDLSRAFSDMLQAVMALKGEWALVLANQAKEEQAIKKNDLSKLTTGPKTSLNLDAKGGNQRVNADGSPRTETSIAIEARQLLRINRLCNFLLLEDELVAGSLVVSVIQALEYPDAYTCRRCIRICHRILETVAHEERYTNLLGQEMFKMAVKNIVLEPKWMVGVEWDMISLVRDIYCRLVLGQTLQPGGQGAGMQQQQLVVGVLGGATTCKFEQSKTVSTPLQGGGILCSTSDLPQQMLANLPGVGVTAVNTLNAQLKENCSAKDQKDHLRDLLRVAAENLKDIEGRADDDNGSGLVTAQIFGRAVEEESVLSQKARAAALPNIPEKLVTHSQVVKEMEKKQHRLTTEVLGAGSTLGDLFG